MWSTLDATTLEPAAIAVGAVLLLSSLIAFVWMARGRRGPRELTDRALRELARHAAPSPLAPGRERGTLELPEPSEPMQGNRVRVLIRADHSERAFYVPPAAVGQIEGRARDLGYVVLYRGSQGPPRWDLWTTG